MNYITHLNQWMELVAVDDRLTPNHISIYLALFQLWNRSRFPEQLTVCRNEVLGISKIGSSKTYYKCLHNLHEYGYLRYRPSYNPLRGSVIEICMLDDTIEDKEKEGPSERNGQWNTDQKKLPNRSDTVVGHGKNRPGTCGKNDTGITQEGTPLYINSLNRLNSKHREGNAHQKNIDDDVTIKKRCNRIEEHPAGERKKIMDNLKADSDIISAGRGASYRKSCHRGSFSKPTLDEVKAFFLEMAWPPGSGRDQHSKEQEAVKFFHHFESNGWLVGGRSPMRNWKAACRSWVAKIPYFNRKSALVSGAPTLSFQVNQQKDFAIPL